ncbi:MAG: DUF3667 domain-containing protein [Chthoniobacterales bacterium]
MQESVPQVQNEPPICANCGANLAGQYCHHCGQEHIRDPLAVKALVGDVATHITDIEHAKGFRTLRVLLTQPGRLTNEYCRGRRAPWIAPLKLYLTIFALSFFLYSAFKSVAVYDVSTLAATEKSGHMTQLLSRIAEKSHVTLDAYTAAVNAKWRTYLSFAQIVYPVVFAIALKLFYWRRRFMEHSVFSLHYQAFALLIVIIAWPLYFLVGLSLTQRSVVVAALVTLVMMAYLVLAIRAVYRQSWTAATIKGLLLYVAYYVIYVGITYSALAAALIRARQSS